ncbi:inositol monophosphatase family protein [Saccharospirillum salsuginis]|uniref:Inositol-1-monophosphatase n=1 Tax=Saccharospirillum salsuginis TaxID=418750 RepID=A0A918NBB4_9GAMM|nr:inositol monophosphatase family protein [Saccharospirillum salsuginis]GGX55883.1 inositol monophosphatase [Saccharospirillum salsuginis]
MTLTSRLAFTRDLAIQAGQLIRKRRETGRLERSFKGGVELVTDADLAAEKLIKTALQASHADDAILAEETAERPSGETLLGPLWVIDPIDGTVNYAHDHNMVAVSIAWYDRGEAQIGVVYNPFLDECFTAIRGQGAWLNDEPITVSGKSEIGRALVATGFPYQKEGRDELIQRLGRVMSHCADVRRLGSAALDICWVACGRLDAYYETVSPWDSAAAQLVAREAGARLGRFKPTGSDLPEELEGRHWLISTPGVYDDLLMTLKD